MFRVNVGPRANAAAETGGGMVAMLRLGSKPLNVAAYLSKTRVIGFVA